MKEPPPDCGPRLVLDEQAAVGLDGLLEVDGQADIPGGRETVMECLFVDGTGWLAWQRALELDACLPEIVGQGDPCNTGLYVVLQAAFWLDCLPGIDKHGLVPTGRLVIGGVCLFADATGFELQVAFGVDGLLGVEGHGDAVAV